MKFRYAFPAILLIIIFAATAIGQTLPELTELDYGEHSVDIKLEPNEMAVYAAEMRFGDRLEVELQVTGGGNADFFLLDTYTAYQTYMSEQTDIYFLEYPYSQSNSQYIKYDYSVLHNDTLVIIVDNTAYTEGGASPTGTVYISGQISVIKSPWTLNNIIILAIVIVVIIVVFTKFRFKPKK